MASKSRIEYKYSPEYALLLHRLTEARLAAGLTQAQVAARLDQPQQWVSNVERGRRRLDPVELRAYCEAIEVSFIGFTQGLDEAIRRELGTPSSGGGDAV